MENLDFSSAPPPANKPKTEEPLPQDPKLCRSFFESAGESETYAVGKTVFVEQEKPGGLFSRGAKIYLLIEGQVALTRGGKPLHLVLPGEIFGELALISAMPRSATATALKPVRLLALDEKRFLASLQKVPEFALLLVSNMLQQLRHSIDRLLATRKEPLPSREEERGLDEKMIRELRKALDDPALMAVKAGEVIVNQGAVGAFMFLVIAGRVAVALDGQRIETIGPGEIFGEAALLGPTQRAATATADTDVSWVQVSRKNFLSMVQSQPSFGIALLRSLSNRVQHVGRLLSEPATP